MLEAAEKLSTGGVAVVIYVVTEEDLTDSVKQSGGWGRIIPIPIEASLEGRM